MVSGCGWQSKSTEHSDGLYVFGDLYNIAKDSQHAYVSLIKYQMLVKWRQAESESESIQPPVAAVVGI